MKVRKLLVLFLAIGLMIANCLPLAVYAEDGTGIWVTDFIDSVTGGYGAYAEARASCSQYPSSQYNYRSSGCIYNSHLAISGVAETWGPKSFG